MKPSEVLDKAADVIIRDGWWQKTYYKEPNYVGCDDQREERIQKARESAPCCQAGAISRAAFGVAWMPRKFKNDNFQAWAEAEEYMRKHVFATHSVEGAIVWNDRSTTTAEDVVEALRGAAALAREAGE